MPASDPSRMLLRCGRRAALLLAAAAALSRGRDPDTAVYASVSPPQPLRQALPAEGLRSGTRLRTKVRFRLFFFFFSSLGRRRDGLLPRGGAETREWLPVQGVLGSGILECHSIGTEIASRLDLQGVVSVWIQVHYTAYGTMRIGGAC